MRKLLIFLRNVKIFSILKSNFINSCNHTKNVVYLISGCIKIGAILKYETNPKRAKTSQNEPKRAKTSQNEPN